METPEIKAGLCFNRELGGLAQFNTLMKLSILRGLSDILKYDHMYDAGHHDDK